MLKYSITNIIDNDQLPRRNLFFELGIYCMFDGTFGVWRITPKALNVSYNSFSSISGSRFPMKILAPTSRFLLCADAWKQISWKLNILPDEYNTHMYSDGQGWEKKNDTELKYRLGAFGLTFLFLIFWAQSFECQIELTQGYILTWVSSSFYQNTLSANK